MTLSQRHGKMLVCLVGRHKGELLISATKAAGARGGTITFGRTVGDNPILQALSLADVQQDIVFTIMGTEADAVFAAVKKAAAENPKKLQGYAVVMDISSVMTRAQGNKQNQCTPEQGNGRTSMDSGYRAITVITDYGYADDVMAAARNAGATGGTIVNARGTGTEEDVKFFGITLVPEKELLIIIAEKKDVKNIIDAISTVPKLNKPGGGIIYTMNVEEFVVLGK